MQRNAGRDEHDRPHQVPVAQAAKPRGEQNDAQDGRADHRPAVLGHREADQHLQEEQHSHADKNKASGAEHREAGQQAQVFDEEDHAGPDQDHGPDHGAQRIVTPLLVEVLLVAFLFFLLGSLLFFLVVVHICHGCLLP